MAFCPAQREWNKTLQATASCSLPVGLTKKITEFDWLNVFPAGIQGFHTRHAHQHSSCFPISQSTEVDERMRNGWNRHSAESTNEWFADGWKRAWMTVLSGRVDDGASWEHPSVQASTHGILNQCRAPRSFPALSPSLFVCCEWRSPPLKQHGPLVPQDHVANNSLLTTLSFSLSLPFRFIFSFTSLSNFYLNINLIKKSQISWNQSSNAQTVRN